GAESIRVERTAPELLERPALRGSSITPWDRLKSTGSARARRRGMWGMFHAVASEPMMNWGKAAVVMMLVPSLALAQANTGRASPAAPLVMGETFTIQSAALGETRRINVYLPAGYSTSASRLPVLYMPDGGMAEDFLHVAGLLEVSLGNETMRPFILVGIE